MNVNSGGGGAIATMPPARRGRFWSTKHKKPNCACAKSHSKIAAKTVEVRGAHSPKLTASGAADFLMMHEARMRMCEASLPSLPSRDFKWKHC